MVARGQIAAVLGSGGHTAELFRLLAGLDSEAGAVSVFFITPDDRLALPLIDEYAAWRQPQAGARRPAPLAICVPRPRRVGQSWLTTPWTVLVSLVVCTLRVTSCNLFRRTRLDLVICNGPALSVILSLAIYLASIVCCLVGARRTRILYIESFARTRRLSLSGRLMAHLADRFIVQWPALASPATASRRGLSLCTAVRREYHGMVL